MIALLLSVGRHPMTLRHRMNPACARAAELALRSGRQIAALHVGDPSNPALRDYLGLGIGHITVLDPHGPADALPILCDALAAMAPRLVICGDQAETGEGAGMLPYALAQHLGLALLPGVIGIEGEAAVQSVSPTLHRRYALDRPVMLIVGANAPAARPISFARARAGTIETRNVMGQPDQTLTEAETRPARARPRRIGGAPASGGGGPALTGLTPDQAAEKIADFLRTNAIIKEDTP